MFRALQKIKGSRLGQHLSEFLVLFLAMSLVFVGMRLYMKRAVNAKLKHTEIQLNEAVGSSFVIPAVGDIKMLWRAKLVNTNGQTVYDCGSGEEWITQQAYNIITCWEELWWNHGCRLCISTAQADSIGLTIHSPACHNACRRIKVNLKWPNGEVGWRELGITIDPTCGSCDTSSNANVGCCYCPGCGNGPHSQGKCGGCAYP